MLPELQKGLPVEEKYKQEEPGAGSDLNAYNVIYYAGSANAGSKTIAINLPNDEEIQLKQGTRRLQLENAMRAKYDKILVPISKVLMAEDQQQYLTFDAFLDRKSTRLNSSHVSISYAVFCLKKTSYNRVR